MPLIVIYHVTKMIKTTIITIIMMPFVTTDVKKPIKEPIPVLNACFMPDLVTISSEITAPKNGPSKMPATGMIKGPMSKPIVLPHIPAFEPPNFFTPKRFESVSAPNKRTMNRI